MEPAMSKATKGHTDVAVSVLMEVQKLGLNAARIKEMEAGEDASLVEH